MRGLFAMVVLAGACGGVDADGGTAPPGTVVVRAGGEACKVTLRAEGRTPPLVLHEAGSMDDEGHVGRWLGEGVVAVDDFVLATRCDVRVPVPPGRYAVTVSRGPEHEAYTEPVEVGPRETATVTAELEEAVDSSGWACGDLHVHSAPSVDSDVPLEQRLVSAVAEGLDLMVASDHDALGDWRDALTRTALEGRLVVIPGNEISPGVTSAESKGHFNVYPIPEDLPLPDAMPHLGLTVEQILGGARSAAPGAILQINHPRRDPWFGYFSLIDCIAQITDLHVGPTIRADYARSVTGVVNGLEPDLIAVTGDLVDGYVPDLRSQVAPLAELSAPDGVYFVTGNHEYYRNPEEWLAEVARLGMVPLVNAHRLVERGDARLLVAGVTDYGAGRLLESHATDPERALAGAPAADFKLLLAHQPRSIHAAARAGFDLQLSGHTHGGQFFPWTLFVGLAHPFVEGLHLFERTWIYVSRGTGYWGPPLRAGAPSEITLLTLRRT